MSLLYIIATPIGNLEDLTFRALWHLKEADLIICEDTRRTQKLLSHYGLKKALLSYHAQSKFQKFQLILEKIKQGKSMALVSDSGTPGISDPGAKLISFLKENLKEDLKIIPIPGPSALTSAASASGLPVDRFLFLGFLPRKGQGKFFQEIKDSKRTVIFYESPHRILKTLKSLEEILGEKRKVVICRELTKKFEEIISGSANELLLKVKPKGEFVVLISPQ